LPGFGAVVVTVTLLMFAGCAHRTPRAYTVVPAAQTDAFVAARRTLAHLYPPGYKATQRAVITIGRKQFACDGMLTVSPQNGHHLAVVSTMGLVTEVAVRTNRTSELLRTTPLFREQWSRDFVARDLRRLFMPREDLDAGGRLPDGRLVLATSPAPDQSVVRYVFTPTGNRLLEMEVARSGQRLYHARIKRYKNFSGFSGELPAEFEVVTPRYRLNLLTAEMAGTSADAPAGRP
jgi:hypothetical protein